MPFAAVVFVLVSRQIASRRHFLRMRIIAQELTSSLRISPKSLRCFGNVDVNLHAFLTQALDVIYSTSLLPTVDWLHKRWLIDWTLRFEINENKICKFLSRPTGNTVFHQKQQSVNSILW
jgi:hypothetical protein